MTFAGTPNFYSVFSTPNTDKALERVRQMLVSGGGAWFAHYMLSGDPSSTDAIPDHEDAVSTQELEPTPFAPYMPETSGLDQDAYAALEAAELVHEYTFSDGPYDRYAVLARAYYNLASAR